MAEAHLEMQEDQWIVNVVMQEFANALRDGNITYEMNSHMTQHMKYFNVE